MSSLLRFELASYKTHVVNRAQRYTDVTCSSHAFSQLLLCSSPIPTRKPGYVWCSIDIPLLENILRDDLHCCAQGGVKEDQLGSARLVWTQAGQQLLQL